MVTVPPPHLIAVLRLALYWLLNTPTLPGGWAGRVGPVRGPPGVLIHSLRPSDHIAGSGELCHGSAQLPLPLTWSRRSPPLWTCREYSRAWPWRSPRGSNCPSQRQHPCGQPWCSSLLGKVRWGEGEIEGSAANWPLQALTESSCPQPRQTWTQVNWAPAITGMSSIWGHSPRLSEAREARENTERTLQTNSLLQPGWVQTKLDIFLFIKRVS